MTDRELLQMALEALRHLCLYTRAIKGYDGEQVQTAIDALKARLAQPENKFNPDWDAMAVMVEEQQRMAKRIEGLEAQLAQPEPAECDGGQCGIGGYCKQCPKTQPEPEPVKIDGNTSDGYHTFNELYEFRKAYNAALFNEWASTGKCSVHKSWRHNDGELCFGGGWFIVVAVLPQGQISNHYEAKDWDLFKVAETDKALFEFDGHTGIDVIARLMSYAAPPQRDETSAKAAEWVGLTDEEIIRLRHLYDPTAHWNLDMFARAIEAKLKEKNT
jgi:hypothetical protein